MRAALRTFAPYLVGAACLIVLAVGVWLYGDDQYRAGYGQAEINARLAAIEIARAAQEEKDRADAVYRGAILARQAAEKNAATAGARVASLLADLRRPRSTKTSVGPDGAGEDWIGLLGACVAEYEWMGGQAGRLADKVGGLQGYIRALNRNPNVQHSRP